MWSRDWCYYFIFFHTYLIRKQVDDRRKLDLTIASYRYIDIANEIYNQRGIKLVVNVPIISDILDQGYQCTVWQINLRI